MHARAAHPIVQQRVVVEPYLLGVDPRARPVEARREPPAVALLGHHGLRESNGET